MATTDNMHTLTSKLIVYKNIDKQSILMQLSNIFKRFKSENYNKDELIQDIYLQIHRLLDVATKYGFERNLWKCYIAYLLAVTENPFTLVSEKTGRLNGSVNNFALNDLSIFKQLFDYDFSVIEKYLDIDCFSIISNYVSVQKSELVYNKSMSEKVLLLTDALQNAHNLDQVYEAVIHFYKTYGVGLLGLNRAFKVTVQDDQAVLEPITSLGNIHLDDLIGYDIQKEELLQNTRAFLQGKSANNVLLYGDAGTGKSTSVKAIANQYYKQGLRVIEIYKQDFKYLKQIIDQIKNRNYRFILFMDDLSFEEFETDYKYLKAIIEGGLDNKPENLVIYATSNRRHIIRETWSDRTDSYKSEDVHHYETVQEKLSLSERFGLLIGYFTPSREQYHDIVIGLAKRYSQIKLTDKQLIEEADKWSRHSGGFSGRSAQQFINALAGSKED